ncbi:DUF485 domain-containing protein [Sphingosinicella rhizophila]|uniref:DUF485 domain-containing protein n=1 Tax=Sphingosinicella rhizophila TaxID=3050082 RepID=A0ABU3Q8N9_9SPHN|nr:DUF485 domain-containing protein [Sphingosinicella sp. GR2756]MDT9599769.1 DUF485 domain-containing protein [Sphingosinicella sp. GR2756]
MVMPLRKIAEDPCYQALVARRARFTWALSGVMLVVFFGYILVIAFNKELLARPIGDHSTTWGIPVGLGVILVAILLTGIYVRRAKRDFDPAARALVEKYTSE